MINTPIVMTQEKKVLRSASLVQLNGNGNGNGKTQSNENTDSKLNENLAACPKCNKICNNSHNLQVHMKTHSKVFIKCNFCERKFQQQNYLRRHLKTHKQAQTATSIFTHCYFNCGEKFKSKHKLKAHHKRHLEEIKNELFKRKRTPYEEEAYKQTNNILTAVISEIFRSINSNEHPPLTDAPSPNEIHNNQNHNSDSDSEEIININATNEQYN